MQKWVGTCRITRTDGRPRRRSAIVVTAVIALVVVFADAGSAAAHSDTGAFDLVALRPTETDHEVEVIVDLAYDDGHAVYRGSVELSARSEAGASLLPVVLDATTVDGRYVTRVELPPPGVWSIQLASTEPAATYEVVFDASSPVYVDRSVDPPPVGANHGPPWRWTLLGMAAVGLVALVMSRRRDQRLPATDTA